MTSRSEIVELHGAIGTETEKAILFTPDGSDPIWIPLSQVEQIHRTEGRLLVTAWIAREKGLA
jgi:hypothetical protein